MTEVREFSPSRCPLCGEPNQCAVARGEPHESCWCMKVSFAPGALDELPEAARNRYCVCQRCATKNAENADRAG